MYCKRIVESDFECYIVKMFQQLEMKINDLHKQNDQILEKLSGTNQQEKEKIDVFEYLPIKNEHELKSLESKLANNIAYRNQMVRTIALILRSICLK